MCLQVIRDNLGLGRQSPAVFTCGLSRVFEKGYKIWKEGIADTFEDIDTRDFIMQ